MTIELKNDFSRRRVPSLSRLRAHTLLAWLAVLRPHRANLCLQESLS